MCVATQGKCHLLLYKNVHEGDVLGRMINKQLKLSLHTAIDISYLIEKVFSLIKYNSADINSAVDNFVSHLVQLTFSEASVENKLSLSLRW
jgi:hypothetical protein